LTLSPNRRSFGSVIDQMEPLLKEILECPLLERGAIPTAPKKAGVYLFTEAGKPMYVGRTRDFQRRWGEHTAPGSRENSAPFAFNIARREAAAEGFDVGGSRTTMAARPGFDDYFRAAKQRVRAMTFQFVSIGDPAVSTVFEVYASMALGTEGEFNLFETH
jgi:GIY-YIG catalytic domain